MSLMELAKKRYSVRGFKADKVEEEKLAAILEAGRIAPTGANRQPQRIIVVREPEGLEKLKKGANVYGAPLALIVCGNHDEAWKRPLDGKDITDIDATIVTDHMMLEATEQGLGSIWVCYFKKEVISEEFGLPDNVEPINILGIGYAAGEAASPDRFDTARKPIEATVSYESYK